MTDIACLGKYSCLIYRRNLVLICVIYPFKVVGELNNEKHKMPRKNFMAGGLFANMRRSSHEIFSGHFVLFVVKKIPQSPSFADAIQALLCFWRGYDPRVVFWQKGDKF